MRRSYEASFLTAVAAMAYRQVRAFLRMRPRVVMSFMRPLMWLFFFGLGWAMSLRGQAVRTALGGLSFTDFIVPGVSMMAVFFTSFFAGTSVIWDREFGFLKETLVAPAPRSAVILGRVLGDSAVAVLQGLITLAIAYPLMDEPNLLGLPLVITAMLLTALIHASLGSAIGSAVNNIETFQLIQMTMAMPMMFMGGTVVPLYNAPAWMRMASMAVPLTYGVDAARSALTGVGLVPLWLDMLVLSLLTPAFVLMTAKAFENATAS